VNLAHFISLKARGRYQACLSLCVEDALLAFNQLAIVFESQIFRHASNSGSDLRDVRAAPLPVSCVHLSQVRCNVKMSWKTNLIRSKNLQ
jgi:hypothetical protein